MRFFTKKNMCLNVLFARGWGAPWKKGTKNGAKNIQAKNSELKIIYKLRNSSLIQDIREVRFSDKYPKNIEPINLDNRCEFKSKKIQCFFGDWEAGYRENFEIIVKDISNNAINSQIALCLIFIYPYF